MDFNKYMIVYEKDDKRVDNYNKINSIIGCHKFPAIDSVNFFNKFCSFGKENKYITQDYLNKIGKYPGKLGCLLSHVLLLKDILENSTTDWNLILEDDTEVIDYDKTKINNILEKANDNNSNYIQLYTNNKFYNLQVRQAKISDNLYKMARQWGTCTYLINKEGIKFLLSRLPFHLDVDMVINSHIKSLNAFCWINNMFVTKGSNTLSDKNSKFGSLIWKVKSK